jgi:UDP-N-acetyl-D-glucosamine dehydrogenase
MNLRDKIRSHTAKIAIIGQGYTGLAEAVELANVGFDVTGIDLDNGKVIALNRGESYIDTVPSESLRRLIDEGRYHATTNMDVLAESDAIIICVPTPLRKTKDPDISFVYSSAAETKRYLRQGHLIVLESTTYPGTTRELLLPMFEKGGLTVGEDFFLAYSPHRIDPGNFQFGIQNIPQVVGGITPECGKIASFLFAQIVPKVTEVSSTTVAELSKLWESTFRWVNIGLVNELAIQCRELGMSVWEVIEAAATKPFGFMPFSPGPGVGGHGIGIDPIYLSWKVRLGGYESKFIALAEEVNSSMPQYVIDLTMKGLNKQQKCLNGSRILVLGVAYKRGVADTRESPAINIIDGFQQLGARVKYCDPFISTLQYEGLDTKRTDLTEQSVKPADAVVIVTDHKEFDYHMVARQAKLVIDTRNACRGITPRDNIITL